MLSKEVQTGYGASAEAVDVFVIPKGFNAVVGDVVALDCTMTQATSATQNTADSVWTVVVSPLDTHVKYGFVGIMLTTTPAGQKGKAKLVGVADAYVLKSSGSIAVGDVLVASASGRYLDAIPGSGNRVVGRALRAVTTPTTRTLCQVAFDGIHGLGTYRP